MGKFPIGNSSPDSDLLSMSRIRKAIAKHTATKQKCWRDSITFETRKDVMIKFAKAIFPPSDSNATTSTLPGRQHLEYARHMECKIFQTACDYDEYVKKIGQEISKVAGQWTEASVKPTDSPPSHQVRSPYSIESLISR
ncbi:hypothetical protein QR680_006865 [Steinernema hermaphroditum]|uniref:KIX domain-containing protein n=1 Tax=Steinernema hermaphroditum TaxID=289476 RepID=A0AA39HZ52_9BILA|nr:hypothetical protein QR680_006865 [Steinernema hermaphroditum]